MTTTFSTCWYNFKSKFPSDIYLKWADNILSNVNMYNLVIYSDEESCQYLKRYLVNPRIKIVIKPHTEFYNYKYRSDWEKNHENNHLLNGTINWKVDWKVNMLWCEKVHFVAETAREKYFDTEFYGWCDIGYFREGPRDLSRSALSKWCAPEKINTLMRDKIYYALINNDTEYMSKEYYRIMDKTEFGLPKVPTSASQVSIGGGFFITYKDNVEWWANKFDETLQLYFKYSYLVKDDQIIILDCVLSNNHRFCLCKENNVMYDNWFLFQRFLL